MAPDPPPVIPALELGGDTLQIVRIDARCQISRRVVKQDKVDQGIDRAGDAVDDKTGGKYAGHVDKGQDAAKDQIDKLQGDGGGGSSI